MRIRACVATVLLGVVACSPGHASPRATPARTGSPGPTSTASRPAPGATRGGAVPLAPAPPGSTLIGVLGDYGVDDQPVHDVVAEMAQFGPLAAVLTTGDDAYERGTPAEAAFGRAVLTPLLHGATRLVGVVGNHDVATDGGRPVERALGMPARWYRTIVGPVEVVVLDANDPGNAAQLRFLSATMGRRRTTPWRIVAFHQPAYACSLHTADEAVQRLWLPLFRGRVDLVLSGHNHSYERFTGTGGTPFVTTGGGGAPLYPSLSALCTGGGHVELLRAVHHALRLAVTTHRLRLEAVDVRGQVFDTLVLTR